MDGQLLITDASTLLNFLRVHRFDLVQGLGFEVRIVDAVFEEIRSERLQLEELLANGLIKTLTLEGRAITETVAHLLSLGLGSGESFSFAAAIEFEGAVAVDDQRAIKRLRTIAPNIEVFPTADIVLAGIRSSLISVLDADALKEEWSSKHRFRLKFTSFGDLLR